jgi:ATP-dependent DNA ligase
LTTELPKQLNNQDKDRYSETRMTSFPEWVQPMAATLTDKRFTGAEWLFERKFDGIRVLAYKQGTEVRLFSRNQLPLNGSYPAVAAAISGLPVNEIVLDGEATGAWGRPGRLVYHVFDLMWLDGRDVTSLTPERRELLRDCLCRPDRAR